jgi:Ca2+-binding EF-hand superfamily protein
MSALETARQNNIKRRAQMRAEASEMSRKWAQEAAASAERKQILADRKRMERELSAVVNIQRFARGMHARKAIQEVQCEEMLHQFQLSARGFLAGTIGIEHLITVIYDVLQSGKSRKEKNVSISPGAVATMLDEMSSQLSDEDQSKAVLLKHAAIYHAKQLKLDTAKPYFSSSTPTGNRQQHGTVHLDVPSKEQREQLFDRIDYNGNGALSLAEIDKAVLELWPQFNHKPALMRAYRAADVNGDGFIKRREFRLLLKYVVYFNNLWHKFDELDANHDHRLDLQEFKHGCAILGIRLEYGEAESEFAAMDDNDGGFVLFDEFCTWCAYKHVGAA